MKTLQQYIAEQNKLRELAIKSLSWHNNWGYDIDEDLVKIRMREIKEDFMFYNGTSDIRSTNNALNIVKEEKGPTYIIEGIDLVHDSKTRNTLIRYNPNHQNLVDTSIENNPSEYKIFKDVPVWSVFKRKHASRNSGTSDGNPLVYAFKGERGYRFESSKDRQMIIDQMKKIIQKFSESHQGEITIILPSTHGLNSFLAKTFKEINPNVQIIDDVISKIDADAVAEECEAPNSKFSLYYKDNLKPALRLLSKYVDKMNAENDGYFTYHAIQDNNMRKVIDHTLKLCDWPFEQYGGTINSKHIILMDDTISQGNTLKQAIKLIKSTFTPASITVLTMFSPLEPKQPRKK